MKKNILSLLFIVLTLPIYSQHNYVKYVKPIIGTQRMGHVYPGASAPFGMVQLSPDTDTIPYSVSGKYNPEVYKYCAGYQYDDKTIVGFSHTHFSGTGHSDLGDFLVMPTVGKLQLNPGTADKPLSGFRSSFTHTNETAEAGYYKVKLDDDNILAELTASNRVGFHQYTFPKSDEAHIILDLMSGIYNYPEKNVWTYVRVVNDTLITGYRQTNGWAKNRIQYFALSFSKPFLSYGSKNFEDKQVYRGFWGKFNQTKNFPEISGKQLRMHFDFKTENQEKIKIKLALSSVSMSGALQNLTAEIQHWNFDSVVKQTQDLWEKELSKIEIEGSNELKENFYTAMYHSFLAPTTYMDIDGKYKGLDQEIHQAKGFTNYTTFSLWDTYRALHPLFNILQPKRNNDMAHSMMKHYEQSAQKMLPIWSHHANDNWCMSGYHSVSVVADAILKNVYTGDPIKALEACVATAKKLNYEGIGDYIDKGFIPAEKSGISVSNTLEYAYDDWAIAQLAKKVNRQDVYEEFMRRSGNWKNNFDKSSGFMRPKLADGTFKKEFDILSTHGQGFIEGNSWNYSFFVPHDPMGLIAIMGGQKSFTQKLDKLFSMNLPDTFFAETEDITRDGIIGGYVHGNEPAHHVAYLYNWTNQPWKTQEKIRTILKMQYKPTPDGLGGNDDCGQMSAWFIFSSLGFYPVAPGSNDYAIGSPSVDYAKLNLENGKSFEIKVLNQSDKNIYVSNMTLNDKPLSKYFITYEDIMKGGTLKITMSDQPEK
ncbi:alpha-1,2-mannosidase [Flavobacterium limnosediminis JC2902]|uniref:Alpha-1,2-mannosidase n=1 Tax=Flavobacterium limnosediminis JC2902 TaxID=1341181 RepID=V6STN4_9FLAO|nr:GH92 family glycosyl hydrolase [Flavobacterium limnosediminis]ESU29814.1 alpha-1,2-mannosidase [Flavobacterium limnosediminis JC2902]